MLQDKLKKNVARITGPLINSAITGLSVVIVNALANKNTLLPTQTLVEDTNFVSVTQKV